MGVDVNELSHYLCCRWPFCQEIVDLRQSDEGEFQ